MVEQKRNQALVVSLSARQVEVLSKERNKHSVSEQMKRRIDIILLSHKGKANTRIASDLGTTVKTVRNWRNRWVSNYPKLQCFEKGESGQGVSDLALRRYMLSILKDLARSGTPKKFTAAQENQIVALACEKPCEHDIPVTDWTHEILAKVAISKNIVPTISSSQIGRILKNEPTPTSKI